MPEINLDLSLSWFFEFQAPGHERAVLDLWENQKGVSNVYLTYFDYFFWGQYKLGDWEAPEGGWTPNPPDKSSTVNEYRYSNTAS